MDILELIRTEVSALPQGAHLHGLQAVLQHIETAYKHLARGQSQSDDSAFTDAIYRTNQAFEGSAKEAYRVLAARDPSNVRPYDVEQHLSENKVFKDRVLTQFTNYRKAWRNPSTHDHTLTFDEAEAFLAIVSVSAFVKLLVDEIAERLSFDAAKKETENQAMSASPDISAPTVQRLTEALKNFAKHYSDTKTIAIESEAQLMGALSGFFSLTLPDLEITTGRIFRTDKAYYTDIVASKGSETIIIELKRAYNSTTLNTGVHQLFSYMAAAKTTESILFFYTGKSIDYTSENVSIDNISSVTIVRPR